MKKLLLLFLFQSFLLNYFSTQTFASNTNQQAESVTLTDIAGRAYAISFSIGEYGYIGLGNSGSVTYYKDLWKFDPTTNNTTQMTDFPGVARRSAVSFVIDGYAYVGLGSDESRNYLKDFYKYDPVNNEWTSIADFGGVARNSAVAFVIDGKAYVGTGRGTDGPLGDFWVYDPATNQWSQTSAFSGDPRQSATGFALNGKGYLIGGVSYDGGTFQYSDVQEFDPSTGKWTEKVFADYSLGINDASSFVLAGEAYIAYGNKKTVVKYDPFTNNVTSEGDIFNIASSDSRPNGISFVIDSKAYFGFGYTGFFTTTYHNDLNTFEIQNSVPTDINLSNTVIDENNSVGAVIGTFTTVDADVEDTHEYFLVEGDGIMDKDNSLFTIDGDQLIINVSTDWEDDFVYDIYVKTVDNKGASYFRTFQINVRDINEAPVLDGPTAFQVYENPLPDHIVEYLYYKDPEGDYLTYTIKSGNIGNSFTIDNQGKIIVIDTAAIDYESRTQFTLVVEITDEVNTIEETITIDVLNINEVPTIEDATFTINENSEANSLIGELSASDPENDDLTFQITNGNDNGTFRIEGNQLLVNNPEALDYEQTTSFTLTIEVSDGEVFNFDEAIITINLLDVNDDLITGIDDLLTENTIVYPNPVLDRISVKLPSGFIESEFSIEIYNLEGKMIKKINNYDIDKVVSFDVQSLKGGIYTLHIMTDENLIVKRFIKK
ncbi:Kelch repeat-containing protein [Marinigracilibium pacificum]|uniref:T9SS type A sorting domain-containing protein n=1 Tax=Marinigracilibium pacificum TaxID=2729599 RepID=A0A848J3L8_9BACT|nr:cadherin domain-containing protein [Marinigracilibium pacificum]NMM49918.1 T9SS type A sorting domain-containing protein [Marinigracilibium pacificum]